MAFTQYDSGLLSPGIDDVPSTPTGFPQKSTALSNRLTSILSTSFADGEIREALKTLDARGIRNSADTRRNLRLDVQKEVIDCNGDIIKDFGQVAEVRQPPRLPPSRYSRRAWAERIIHTATQTHWLYHSKFEPMLRGYAPTHPSLSP